MGTGNYAGYLGVLSELTKTLQDLTEIEQQKTNAVRNDDLKVLNDCMRQEQALSLALRGLEQKRLSAMSALGMQTVSLNALIQHVPQEYRQEAKQVVEGLQAQYALFHSASEVARNTLECNLHQIEKVLVEMGADVEPGAGFKEKEPELPPTMRTDFRA